MAGGWLCTVTGWESMGYGSISWSISDMVPFPVPFRQQPVTVTASTASFIVQSSHSRLRADRKDDYIISIMVLLNYIERLKVVSI